MLRSLRTIWARARWGLDPGDRPPGEEYAHLSGRALRKAVRDGFANPDGSARTRER